MEEALQILGHCKQNKVCTPERGCPSSGQNRNSSVVFLWSNEKSPQFSLRRFPVLEHRNTIDAAPKRTSQNNLLSLWTTYIFHTSSPLSKNPYKILFSASLASFFSIRSLICGIIESLWVIKHFIYFSWRAKFSHI